MLRKGAITITLGERVKSIRLDHHLTQLEFGERIGVSGATVSTTESGKTNPDNRTLSLICREFGINRHWLETGEGEMIDPQVENDIELLTRAMEGQSEAKKKFLRMVAGMPDELLEAVLAHMEKNLGTKNTP